MDKKQHTSHSEKCKWRIFIRISYCALVVYDVIWSVGICRRMGKT